MADASLPSKIDILAILRSRPYGSSVPQFLRDFRLLFGKDFPRNGPNLDSLEILLKEKYNDVIKVEKTADGDTLLRPIVAKDKFLPTFFEQKKPYDVNEQIEKLEADSRGWFSLCFMAPKGVFIESVLRQEFETFGSLADFHVTLKGRVFVRYMLKDSAVKAFRRYGAKYKIYVGRNYKKPEYAEKVVESEGQTITVAKLTDAIPLLPAEAKYPKKKSSEPPPLMDIATMNLEDPVVHVACIHSKTRCKMYPNCTLRCDFLHPICSSEDRCVDEKCRKSHPNRTKLCNLCQKGPRTTMLDSNKFVFDCEHRRTNCKMFPNCQRESNCSFKHPACPTNCKSWKRCSYDHEGQKKPCYVCMKREMMKKHFPQPSADGSETLNASFSSDVSNDSKKSDNECRYGKKCWRPDCFYEHPPDWNGKACPWGISCKRDDCSFVHPTPS